MFVRRFRTSAHVLHNELNVDRSGLLEHKSRGKPLPRSEAANSAVPYRASSDVSVMILASHQIVAVNQLFFAAVAQH